ncbi:hypothetical protein [Intestinimonas butyriciproducens]|uniref:hypothetical protein n=1 Tax=Intestinimonas butyriciproducens TaxID=1297617 RepID=UPI002A80BFBD|nr:hypothetical protein [Intestinimonas butyriciproducens]MDY3616558.1 hypothetical protein [Intestinimonas butyriciproducens]
MTGTDGSLPDACTAALTNGAKWGIFLKAPVEGIEKGILWDTGAAMIWSGIEVVITGLTRNGWGLRPFCPREVTDFQLFPVFLLTYPCAVLSNSSLQFSPE